MLREYYLKKMLFWKCPDALPDDVKKQYENITVLEKICFIMKQELSQEQIDIYKKISYPLNNKEQIFNFAKKEVDTILKLNLGVLIAFNTLTRGIGRAFYSIPSAGNVEEFFETKLLKELGPITTMQIIEALDGVRPVDGHVERYQAICYKGASQLCRLLGEFRAIEAVEMLITIAEGYTQSVEYEDVREAAIIALGNIGDSSVIDRLEKLRNRDDYRTPKSIISDCIEKTINHNVKFIKEYSEQKTNPLSVFTVTYRMYKANNSSDANKFLSNITVTKELFYVVVETPEGNYARDRDGVYKE